MSSRYDIIIDDGSHRTQDIVRSFARYFPYLEETGLYVVEDLHSSYWNRYANITHHAGGLYHPESAISFFKKLLDIVNHEHWGIDKSRSEFLGNFKRRYQAEFDEGLLRAIHSVDFLNSLCVVSKRPASQNQLGARMVAGVTEIVHPGIRALHRGFSPTPDQRRNKWARESAESAIVEELLRAAAAADERFESELNAARAEAAAAQQQLATAQQQLAAAETGRVSAQQQFAVLEADLQTARSELTQERSVIAELQTDLTRLQRERDDAAAARQHQAAALRRLTCELDRLKQDAVEARADATAAREQLVAFETSTIWQATWPIRRALQHLPAGPRRLGRRLAKLAWWSATLRLPAKLRELTRLRAASPDRFDEAGYLAANPDVAAAVVRGEIQSGFIHYLLCGYREGRGGARGIVEPRYRTFFALADWPMPVLPPSELRERVHGSKDAQTFTDIGRRVALEVERALSDESVILPPGSRILDFGCGCGRVMAWYAVLFPNCRLYGTDIDQQAIEWSQANLGDLGQFSQNDEIPPLSFDSDTFDFIYCISIFTHLPEDMQLSWLAELRRVTKIGGYLILTVHGQDLLGPNCKDESKKLREHGFLYLRGSGTAGLPDFYHTSFHTPRYVFEKWSKFFQVVKIIPKGCGGHQDIVICRRLK